MLMQPVPFHTLQGPHGWVLDLVPMPNIGMAAESIHGYLTSTKGKPRMGASGRQAAWRKRLGPFTVWGWSDGSLAVKPVSGQPIPLPLWLHQADDATYPPKDAGGLADVDTDWLRHALLFAAFQIHGTRFSEIASGNLGPQSWPVWWAHGRHPNAQGHRWNDTFDDMAVLAAAWFKAHNRPAPRAVPFSLMGGLILPNGTVQPAVLETSGLGEDLTAFLHTTFAHKLGSLDAVAVAWSAEHHIVRTAAGTRAEHLPTAIPSPIGLVTRDLPTPSAHLVLQVRERHRPCTG